jgi:hypothetical protein
VDLGEEIELDDDDEAVMVSHQMVLYCNMPVIAWVPVLWRMRRQSW